MVRPSRKMVKVVIIAFVILLVLFLLVRGFILGLMVPGCGLNFGYGGCSGKAMIKDLKIEPETSCLTLRINNCNGGIIEIENSCEESVNVGDVKIRERYDAIELSRDTNNSVKVSTSDGNYAQYYPEEDDLLNIEGSIGEKKFTISYTKTKLLCN